MYIHQLYQYLFHVLIFHYTDNHLYTFLSNQISYMESDPPYEYVSWSELDDPVTPST